MEDLAVVVLVSVVAVAATSAIESGVDVTDNDGSVRGKFIFEGTGVSLDEAGQS